MRILELCLSPNQGGLELYAGTCVEELSHRGHIVSLLTTGEGFLKGQFPRAFAFDAARSGWRAVLRSSRRLGRWLDSQGIELIQMHDNNDLLLASFAKRWTRRRPWLLYSRHLHITSSKRDPYHRVLYGQVDKMLATTRAMQSDMQRYVPLPRARTAYLPLGVAVNVDGRDIERARAELNLPKNELIIGAFSRLEHGKGQHVLIEAVIQLRRKGIPVNALVVGRADDGAYARSLRAQAEAQGVERHVRFLPFVKKPMAYMACCDLVAHTAYKETFGLVVVEAMAMSVAVIATNAGGIPEIVRDGESGLLYAPGDAAQLVDRIIRLHRDPALGARLAAAGRARAATTFSKQKHYDRLENIMQGLAACKAQR
jgi:L-malate glycosyltransferase